MKTGKALVLDLRAKESTTVDYINFHLEEHYKNKTVAEKAEAIQGGGLSWGKECFGVFDYAICINGEPGDQLLVVKTDENGELDHIAWES